MALTTDYIWVLLPVSVKRQDTEALDDEFMEKAVEDGELDFEHDTFESYPSEMAGSFMWSDAPTMTTAIESLRRVF